MVGSPGDLDRRLVAALSAQPRASASSLAETIHEPRAVVAAHLRAHLNSGALKVVAVVHPHVSGLFVVAHVSVATDGSPLTALASLVASWPETVLVSAVAGVYDLVLEVRVKNHDDLETLLARVRRHPQVARINSTIYTGVFKGYFEHDTLERNVLDNVDRSLLSRLQQDGRVKWQDLAARVGRSSSAVRARVYRMLNANIARLVVIQGRGRHDQMLTMGVGIMLRTDARSVLAQIRYSKDVEFAVATIGRFDAIVTLTGDSPVALDASLERLRAFPDVTGLDAWTHLRSIKEDYNSPL